MSTKGLVTTVAVFATLFSLPALAATAVEEASLCAAAAEAQGIASLDEYSAKFIKSRGAATKQVVIELISYESGDVLTAQCKIKRGEVAEVELKA